MQKDVNSYMHIPQSWDRLLSHICRTAVSSDTSSAVHHIHLEKYSINPGLSAVAQPNDKPCLKVKQVMVNLSPSNLSIVLTQHQVA